MELHKRGLITKYQHNSLTQTILRNPLNSALNKNNKSGHKLHTNCLRVALNFLEHEAQNFRKLSKLNTRCLVAARPSECLERCPNLLPHSPTSKLTVPNSLPAEATYLPTYLPYLLSPRKTTKNKQLKFICPLPRWQNIQITKRVYFRPTWPFRGQFLILYCFSLNIRMICSIL